MAPGKCHRGRIGVRLMTLALFCSLAIVATAATAQPRSLDGLWATSKADCTDPEGPNSRTLIQSRTFDQYEFHCIIRDKRREGTSWSMSLSCDAEGRKMNSKATVTL